MPFNDKLGGGFMHWLRAELFESGTLMETTCADYMSYISILRYLGLVAELINMREHHQQGCC
jgi:hypothetical protein